MYMMKQQQQQQQPFNDSTLWRSSGSTIKSSNSMTSPNAFNLSTTFASPFSNAKNSPPSATLFGSQTPTSNPQSPSPFDLHDHQPPANNHPWDLVAKRVQSRRQKQMERDRLAAAASAALNLFKPSDAPVKSVRFLVEDKGDGTAVEGCAADDDQEPERGRKRKPRGSRPAMVASTSSATLKKKKNGKKAAFEEVDLDRGEVKGRDAYGERPVSVLEVEGRKAVDGGNWEIPVLHQPQLLVHHQQQPLQHHGMFGGKAKAKAKVNSVSSLSSSGSSSNASFFAAYSGKTSGAEEKNAEVAASSSVADLTAAPAPVKSSAAALMVLQIASSRRQQQLQQQQQASTPVAPATAELVVPAEPVPVAPKPVTRPLSIMSNPADDTTTDSSASENRLSGSSSTPSLLDASHPAAAVADDDDEDDLVEVFEDEDSRQSVSSVATTVESMEEIFVKSVGRDRPLLVGGSMEVIEEVKEEEAEDDVLEAKNEENEETVPRKSIESESFSDIYDCYDGPEKSPLIQISTPKQQPRHQQKKLLKTFADLERDLDLFAAENALTLGGLADGKRKSFYEVSEGVDLIDFSSPRKEAEKGVKEVKCRPSWHRASGVAWSGSEDGSEGLATVEEVGEEEVKEEVKEEVDELEKEIKMFVEEQEIEEEEDIVEVKEETKKPMRLSLISIQSEASAADAAQEDGPDTSSTPTAATTTPTAINHPVTIDTTSPTSSTPSLTTDSTPASSPSSPKPSPCSQTTITVAQQDEDKDATLTRPASSSSNQRRNTLSSLEGSSGWSTVSSSSGDELPASRPMVAVKPGALKKKRKIGWPARASIVGVSRRTSLVASPVVRSSSLTRVKEEKEERRRSRSLGVRGSVILDIGGGTLERLRILTGFGAGKREEKVVEERGVEVVERCFVEEVVEEEEVVEVAVVEEKKEAVVVEETKDERDEVLMLDVEVVTKVHRRKSISSFLSVERESVFCGSSIHSNHPDASVSQEQAVPRLTTHDAIPEVSESEQVVEPSSDTPTPTALSHPDTNPPVTIVVEESHAGAVADTDEDWNQIRDAFRQRARPNLKVSTDVRQEVEVEESPESPRMGRVQNVVIAPPQIVSVPKPVNVLGVGSGTGSISTPAQRVYDQQQQRSSGKQFQLFGWIGKRRSKRSEDQSYYLNYTKFDEVVNRARCSVYDDDVLEFVPPSSHQTLSIGPSVTSKASIHSDSLSSQNTVVSSGSGSHHPWSDADKRHGRIGIGSFPLFGEEYPARRHLTTTTTTTTTRVASSIWTKRSSNASSRTSATMKSTTDANVAPQPTPSNHHGKRTRSDSYPASSHASSEITLPAAAPASNAGDLYAFKEMSEEQMLKAIMTLKGVDKDTLEAMWHRAFMIGHEDEEVAARPGSGLLSEEMLDGITSFQYCHDMKDPWAFGAEEVDQDEMLVGPAVGLLSFETMKRGRTGRKMVVRDSFLKSNSEDFLSFYEDLMDDKLSLKHIFQKHLQL
ncbi:hypothetical protein HDU97_010298 [Phlyctochytrium planicorne]|nr:hypothetical protein HDU97_010298 [Phlyctochytrium planicorne]